MRRAITLLAAVLLSGQAFAAKDTFFVGVEDSSGRQVHPVNGGKYQPVLDAVMTAFALEEGFELEYVPLQGDAYDQWYKENTIDFRFPDHPRWSATDGTLFYSQPVVGICEITRVLPENQWMRIPDVTALGIIEDQPVSSDWLEQERKGYTKIVSFADPTHLVKALVDGEVDAIITDSEQLNDATAALKLSGKRIVASEHIQDKKESLRISSEQYPAMLEKLDEFLKTHRGLIAQVARRHGIDNGRACLKKRPSTQSELAD